MSHESIEVIVVVHLVLAGLLFIVARRKIAALTLRFQSVVPKLIRAPFSVEIYEKAFCVIGLLFLAASVAYLLGR